MNKINICFFIDADCHTFDKWSCIDSLFKSCVEDDDFNVIILKEVDDISSTYDVLLNSLYDKVSIFAYYKDNKFLNLDELNIDYIFTFNPYNSKYINWNDWKDKMRICFIDYGSRLSNAVYGNFIKLPIWNQCWKIFYENKFFKKIIEENNSNASVEILGVPSFDYIFKDEKIINQNLWRLNRNKNSKIKRIIWSPHWTIKTFWLIGGKNEGFSQFTKYADLWLEIPKMFPNLDIIMKPHPNLFIKLEYQTDGEWNEKKVNDWKKKFLNNPNTQIIENGLYDDLFLTSDAIINDSVSFIAQYLPTLKPFLLCENRNGPGYNEWGQKIADCYYKAHNEEDIIGFIKKVVIAGDDYMFNDRKNSLKKNIFIPNIGAGNYIKEYLKKNFIKI